jgi:hypothetical protein
MSVAKHAPIPGLRTAGGSFHAWEQNVISIALGQYQPNVTTPHSC